jgi:hypothetical protein
VDTFDYNYVLKSIELLYGDNRNDQKQYPLKKYLENADDKYHGCEQITPSEETCSNSTINSTSYSCFLVNNKCYDNCDV